MKKTSQPNDLPSSLPSFLPSSDFERVSKRQAPRGQWKTPPQFLYANDSETSAFTINPSNDSHSHHLHDYEAKQRFNGAVSNITLEQEDDEFARRREESKRTMISNGCKFGGISEVEFAAGTGGLALNPSLLAQMSGKKESEIGKEQIETIMQCPDLIAIYQKLQQEDERRLKRLERNRASARLRREKKKNLVETYEQEVSQLENTLQCLIAHQFGKGRGGNISLQTALGETKQQPLVTKEAKQLQIENILAHHALSLRNIEHILTYQLFLVEQSDDAAKLGLTSRQKQQLKQLLVPLQKEQRELAIVQKCLAALQTHDWLKFPGTDEYIDSFKLHLSGQQLHKMVQWTSENKNAISQLHFFSSSNDSSNDVGMRSIEQQEKKIEFFFPN